MARATPRWFSTALTVVGHVRRVNEDAFLDAREQSLWVVADGMGGHSRGDRASQEIIQRLRDFKREPTPKQAVRAIGVADELDVQIREVELIAGDRFLVCSDGLFKDVAFSEVQTNLSLPSPSQALDALVELALRRGGTDNVTAIVVQSPVEVVSEE